MQQIQQLCGADDDPREHSGTGGSKHRDPYLFGKAVRLYGSLGGRMRLRTPKRIPYYEVTLSYPFDVLVVMAGRT